VAQLLATMRDLAVRRVPVVDDGGRVLGLISFDDVLVLLADQLEDLAEVIRKEIGPAL
jgi:CBS domain-containing protein